MATLTAKRKGEIADFLEKRAASWVSGPRAEKLRQVAAELRGDDDVETFDAAENAPAPADDKVT